MYDQAESLARTIDSAEQTGRMMGKVIARYEAVHRASLAGSALAAIAMAQVSPLWKTLWFEQLMQH